jgi:hypothetical protein
MRKKNLSFLGFPLYDICDNGVVISLSYRGGNKEHPMSPHKDTKGYYQVCLRNDKGKKMFVIHRLVAMAFIPNQNNYKQINHKDENKTNNNVDNLEWCDNKYNANYGTRNKRMANALKGTPKPHFWKRVEQLDFEGNHIAYYDNVRMAERETGAFGVSKVCLNKACSAGGYKWRYV